MWAGGVLAGGLPVLDEALVGEFGLFDELALLDGALLRGRGAWMMLRAVAFRGAGAELKSAELAVDDRLAFERVVLFGGD